VLHISIWGIEAFPGGLSGDGTEFWVPVTAPIGGVECDWYGSAHMYGCYPSPTSRSWWIAHTTQRQPRDCNSWWPDNSWWSQTL